MVKFRGIEISIISQFDIRKLPEYRFRQTSPSPDRSNQLNSPFPLNATASCYVPVYPGSQIWFDYNIDGPHPPKAAYFFKLLFNNQVITSFDCGSKHNYHGKMIYNLVIHGRCELTGGVRIVRQALHFSSELGNAESRSQEDVIEFRVHRIEHRKRIKELTVGTEAVDGNLSQNAKLQLTDGGILEPGFPKRRYKYQLLDSVDEPYATFKFFCRTHDYLEQLGIIDPATPSPPTSLYSTSLHDISSSPGEVNATYEKTPIENTSPISSPPKFSIKLAASASDTTDTSRELESQVTLDKNNSTTSSTYLPPSDSEDDLSTVTRDSIEDLASSVPRSPRSPRFQAFADDTNDCHLVTTANFPRSPRSRLKKKLTINLNGAEFDLEPEKKIRSISPFTNGGVLRQLVPPSAPAAVTEFGPSVQQEVESKRDDSAKRNVSQHKTPTRTTRAERSGRSLMGFLSRRVATK